MDIATSLTKIHPFYWKVEREGLHLGVLSVQRRRTHREEPIHPFHSSLRSRQPGATVYDHCSEPNRPLRRNMLSFATTRHESKPENHRDNNGTISHQPNVVPEAKWSYPGKRGEGTHSYEYSHNPTGPAFPARNPLRLTNDKIVDGESSSGGLKKCDIIIMAMVEEGVRFQPTSPGHSLNRESTRGWGR